MYDKKGLFIIGIVFILSTILNTIVGKMSFIGGIPYTIGVFSPYILFSICYLLYYLFKHKKIYFYTDWRVSIWLIIFQSFSLWGTHVDNLNISSKKDYSDTNLAELNKSKIFKKSFKVFLKEKNIDMDINVPNKYETLQPKNNYSNHYFNVVTDFPDNWEHDRGASDFALFRTVNADSAISIALIAVPISTKEPFSDEFHKDFQIAPLKTVNEINGGDYKGYILKQLSLNSTAKIYDFKISEEKIRNTNYLISSYKYNETNKGIEIPFITVQYQTAWWGVSYTFSYSVPFKFYSNDLIETVIKRTNYINPKL